MMSRDDVDLLLIFFILFIGRDGLLMYTVWKWLLVLDVYLLFTCDVILHVHVLIMVICAWQGCFDYY